MRVMLAARVVAGMLIAGACAACGGGGSSTPPPPPVVTPTPVPTATPTPTPAPTPTASPTPAPALVPSALSFINVGSGAAQNVAVSETGYNGTFTASSSNCSGIVSFSAAPFASSIQVTPVAPGTCAIAISDTNGAHTALPVSVTTTTVTGS
ncbi:MAG: hypothetical protein JO036_02790 [Candidatus Eremiobacteraeota bacterium]|nr:hypothetical protein [Candidatus Eremiobacteraeota bacterium]